MRQLSLPFPLPPKDEAQVAFDIYEHETKRFLHYRRLMYCETNVRRRYVWEKRMSYHRDLGAQYFAQFINLTQ